MVSSNWNVYFCIDVVLGGTTVLRGTVQVTVLPWYRNTTNTARGTNSHFSEDFRAKHQFIDRVNKLDLFKLYVDDILVQLATDALALRRVIM